MSNRKGYRGYIFSRIVGGSRAPQHIQQLVMRDYCAKNKMYYLLAATEYAMPGCTMVLDAMLNDLDHMEGIIMYSLFMFPTAREKRMEMYARIIEKGCALHTASEGVVIKNWDDVHRIEDVFIVQESIDKQDAGLYAFLKTWDAEHAGNQFS